VSWYLISVCFIFFSTIAAALWSFFETYYYYNFSFDNLCFLSGCILEFKEKFSGAIEILEFGSSVAYIFIFAGGAYIALKNYLTSVNSAALSGHINHLTMFKDYMFDEVKKYRSLKTQKINVYCWYRLAFPKSSEGKILVSDNYRKVVNGIKYSIIKTNESISSPKGEYGYRKHQDRIIEALKPLGIEMAYLPKNNFTEVEFEIFGLIDSFNHTFTDIEFSLQKCVRDYI